MGVNCSWCAAGLACIAIAGCKAEPESAPARVICTMEARAGLTVEVLDSATQAPATLGATIIARSATVTDSTPGPATAEGTVGLAYERPGTYTVTVTKPGYRGWSRSGISVTADQCHVHPVKVTALLQR